MKPLRARVHNSTKIVDRRVIIEVGSPGRDGVDVLLLDPYGGLYWAAASGYDVIAFLGQSTRDWLDPDGNTMPSLD